MNENDERANDRDYPLAEQPMFPGLGYRRNAAGDITVEPEIHRGATIRTWLAGKALQGFLAYPGDVCGGNEKENVAKRSVEFADAVIAELEKPTDGKEAV